jgi:hypothetical protein
MIYFNWKKSCLGYIVYQNASFFPNIYHICNCQKLKAKNMKKLMIIFSLEDITLFSAIKEIIQCLFEKNVTKEPLKKKE